MINSRFPSGIVRPRAATPIVVAVAAAVAIAGCGGSNNSRASNSAVPKTEVSPAGDIPDNQAFVAYSPPNGGYTVDVPEGWSRSAAGRAVIFTDKLNSVRMESQTGGPVTVSAVKRNEIPKLRRDVNGFELQSVGLVKRKGGSAVRVVYLATAPADPVTGKRPVAAIERYFYVPAGRLAKSGKTVVLTLSGPKGADNVDPWKIITDSVRSN
ncbi:MAG TPA: hypothetical protein VGO97_03060 [Solirubrobacterales bacterium]|jgi:hypothetical protein|nr:hypothetical protein [Solirubrobacterales bacterium]